MLSRIDPRAILCVLAIATLLLGKELLTGEASAGSMANAFARSDAGEHSANISQRIVKNNPFAPQETCPPGTPTRLPTPLFTPAPGCSDVPPTGVLTATITDHFYTTDAAFTNTSASCSYRIGLATYRKFDKNFESQRLYDYTLAIIPPSSTLTLTANNPSCVFQGDAFYGDLIYSFAGGVYYEERRLDDTDGIGRLEFCTAVCSETPIVTDTPTPTETPIISPTAFPACGAGADYIIEPPIPENVVPGVTDIGNHCDDCTTAVTLPFAFNLYGIPFTTANVSSNGTLQFNTDNPSYSNICLPTTNMGYAILPHWDDLRTDEGDGSGVYIGVEGSAPNRIFDIEWRASYYYRPGYFLTFEARLYEGANGEFDLAYNALGSDSVTAGVQRAGGISFTQYVCNTVIISNKRLHFRPLGCGEPTLTPIYTSTPSVTFTSTNTRPPSITNTPAPTHTPAGDAYMLFVPQGSAPPNGGTVNVGDRFVLDLMLNAGSSAPPDGVTVQQSYLTYTYNLIKNARVDQIATTCVLTNTVTTDQSTFDATLQNEICNGPGQCNFRGPLVDPGSFAFASGALSTCPEGCGGVFRVAQVGLCAVAPGRALLHWQFTPPAPPIRDTEIIITSGELVQNPALFTDYVINIANQTSTSTSTPVGLMVGHVTWQGRPAQPNTRQQVPISVSLSLGATHVNYAGVNTDANGFFTVTVGSLPSGNYTWRVKGYDPQWGGPAFLANAGTIALAGAPFTLVEMNLMRAGDANNDNLVTVQDFNIQKSMFGRSCNPSCPDPRADFNSDSLINILDFNLLKPNFGTSGAP